MIQKIIAFFLLLALSPVFGMLWLVHRYTMGGDFIFRQKRAGINQKPFMIYKIRTMIPNAETQKKQLEKLNEADGPVFKMRNDPRYTPFGKWLSHSGLDELPQLWNILKGDMAFVGPRPLPIDEASQIPKKYKARFTVLPGITSSWVVNGSHSLSFEEWMEMDVDDVKNMGLKLSLSILLSTIQLIPRLLQI